MAKKYPKRGKKSSKGGVWPDPYHAPPPPREGEGYRPLKEAWSGGLVGEAFLLRLPLFGAFEGHFQSPSVDDISWEGWSISRGKSGDPLGLGDDGVVPLHGAIKDLC